MKNLKYLIIIICTILFSCSKEKLVKDEIPFLGKIANLSSNDVEIDSKLLEHPKTKAFLDYEGHGSIAQIMSCGSKAHVEPNPIFQINKLREESQNYTFEAFSKSDEEAIDLAQYELINNDEFVRYRVKPDNFFGKTIVLRAKSKRDPSKSFEVESYMPQHINVLQPSKEYGNLVAEKLNKESGYRIRWNADKRNTQGILITIKQSNDDEMKNSDFTPQTKMYNILTEDTGVYTIRPDQLRNFKNGNLEVLLTRGALDCQKVSGMVEPIDTRFSEIVRISFELN